MDKLISAVKRGSRKTKDLTPVIEKELGENVKPVVHIHRECGTTMDEDESYTERGLEADAVYDLWTPVPVRIKNRGGIGSTGRA